jgi:hypothetical protein
VHELLALQQGGWSGNKNISESAYWPLENQWVYMMGDSTQRQVWAAFASPFQSKYYVTGIVRQRVMPITSAVIISLCRQ